MIVLDQDRDDAGREVRRQVDVIRSALGLAILACAGRNLARCGGSM
jgi:predicted metal-dependent phosphotriesterase family hydrolase